MDRFMLLLVSLALIREGAFIPISLEFEYLAKSFPLRTTSSTTKFCDNERRNTFHLVIAIIPYLYNDLNCFTPILDYNQ